MNKFQTGQSLLELTISLGLMLVVISVLAINTVNGLKSSQFSKNQTIATEYAQEGLEKVKSAKNRNCYVQLSGVASPSDKKYWFDKSGGSSIWDTGTDSFGLLIGATPRYFSLLNIYATPECFLTEVTPVGAKDPSLTAANFTRTITIENDVSGLTTRTPLRKKVTSSVSWTDLSGTHQSQLVTIITQ